MPQGQQVRNGKAFEYALAKSDFIEYKGRKYPYRTITVSNDDNYIIVSVKELEDVLVDINGVAYSKEAACLDNKIAYYLASSEDLERSNESILNEIYS